MWAMLRTGFNYDSFSTAEGLYLAATVPVDLAGMLREWPGLKVTGSAQYEQFGACSFAVSVVAREWERKTPPPPLNGEWKAPWSTVQMLVLQRLGADGWEPYAYGPNTSAGYPLHLLRKRLDPDTTSGG